jgi:hypothetical protein
MDPSIFFTYFLTVDILMAYFVSCPRGEKKIRGMLSPYCVVDPYGSTNKLGNMYIHLPMETQFDTP